MIIQTPNTEQHTKMPTLLATPPTTPPASLSADPEVVLTPFCVDVPLTYKGAGSVLPTPSTTRDTAQPSALVAALDAAMTADDTAVLDNDTANGTAMNTFFDSVFDTLGEIDDTAFIQAEQRLSGAIKPTSTKPTKPESNPQIDSTETHHTASPWEAGYAEIHDAIYTDQPDPFEDEFSDAFNCPAVAKIQPRHSTPTTTAELSASFIPNAKAISDTTTTATHTDTIERMRFLEDLRRRVSAGLPESEDEDEVEVEVDDTDGKGPDAEKQNGANAATPAAGIRRKKTEQVEVELASGAVAGLQFRFSTLSKGAPIEGVRAKMMQSELTELQKMMKTTGYMSFLPPSPVAVYLSC